MVISKETRAVIIALHKTGRTGKSIAARKIAPQSTIASSRNSRREVPLLPKRLQGMQEGPASAETLGARPGVKEGSKEASSLQKKHQRQTDILEKVQGVDC
ncbi:hypothetical protein GDO81_024160 [Engystomops pustulosus]|uniref:Uncharacterized protein n=1 Tax=Engystomops pustulosus TaxID=76066 RepID=A0AAV6Z3S0_ENGPU|nr:hypothetical protein GDO81_024160 [Engystomops pustulosus]